MIELNNQIKYATYEIDTFISHNGISEYQVIIHATPGKTFYDQLNEITDTYNHLKEKLRKNITPVFKRYFLSDASNQESYVRTCEHNQECAVSYIQQSPLDGSKIALWIWFIDNMNVTIDNQTYICEHNGYKHFFTASQVKNTGDSEFQTKYLFEKYSELLDHYSLSIDRNCIRTWLYVQNVDVNYAGLVKARKLFFENNGLTPDTHYIASTGIEGRTADYNSVVSFDFYSVSGLQNDQIKYLTAPQYLNPTYEYGVTFERGTSVEYGDRKHVFISGTASIDNNGEIVAPGDIRQQIERTWLNVEALLNDAECSFKDISSIIVYLRDIADYQITQKMFSDKFKNKPVIILLAPVCRPGWLIEMECIAVKACENRKFRIF